MSLFEKLLLKGNQESVPVLIFDINNKEADEEYPTTISKCWLHLKTIKKEAQFNQTYIDNINKLMLDMAAWKKSRGDGNCYYRAVISTYFLKIFHPAISLEHLYNFINILTTLYNSYEYREHIQEIKQIFDFVCEAYNSAAKNEDRYAKFIETNRKLQEQKFDLALVRVARVITYKTFKESCENDEDFKAFLLDEDKLQGYNRIQKMGVEAETHDLVMLPKGLGIEVNQINVFDKIVHYHYPKEDFTGSMLKIWIICKLRGHYDALLSKSDLEIEKYNLKKRQYFYPRN
ncbi:hypothetical protein SteCoe_27719 [Stentor coeruleus]|uniref:ubiquitinyl hydrolase 1 n=1 Tax=Stentor coeruleus TaxID=5963 RepID=A0A1R2BA38_9CILI|nr:hypothetical protein SteCoe_27719 [Stentor coeruleus]